MAGISSFDTTEVSFEIYGPETVKTMAEALENSRYNLKISYRKASDDFTILNSRQISTATIQRLFVEKKHEGWTPEVQAETDEDGNKVVKLVQVKPIEEVGLTISGFPISEYFFPR